MKNFLLLGVAMLCLLLSVNNASAQDTTVSELATNATYTSIWDSMHDNAIDITKVPHQVLYDRVYGWSYLTNNTDISYTNKNRMVQAWYDLFTSSYNFKNNLNYNQFRNHLVQYELNKQIPIIAIQYNYAYLDSNLTGLLPMGIDSNGNYVDSNNIPVPNAPKPLPYSTKQAKLVGLYATEFDQYDSIIIVADDSLFLQNTGAKIKQIRIYSGAELMVTIEKNSYGKIAFNEPGSKDLIIECELNDGQILKSQQNITIQLQRKLRFACGVSERHERIESAIPFQGYDETFPTTTWIDYHTYPKFLNNDPSNCDNKITKPIFFLDGFDAQNQRGHEEIYNKYITTNKVSNQGNVARDLRLRGYDLIIVNFPRTGEWIKFRNASNQLDSFQIPTALRIAPGATNTVNVVNRDGGTDFVERNAMAFIALIQRINDSVANNTPNGVTPQKSVIIGPSMGGQISRYALAYMEKRLAATPNLPAWDHKCRLWISFDSPHAGANIPIGLQQALDHLGNFYGQQDAVDNLNKKVNSRAARQFLIERLDGLYHL
jgi:hypothetical protein